jgi:hypothetical protein
MAMAGALLAQEATTPQFDPAVVDAIIVTGIGGLGVAALTELIKRLLKAAGVLAYVISGVVSAAATAMYLVTSGSWDILSFAIYSVLVFLSANGIYKFSAKAARNE